MAGFPAIYGYSLTGNDFAVGDVITVTWTNNGAATVKSIMAIYTPAIKTAEISVAPAESKTFTLTVTDDAQSAIYFHVEQSTLAPGDVQIDSISCSRASSGDTSQETTSRAVTTAVARSQTTVIQQNIGARVAAVTSGGSAGAGASGGAAGGRGAGGGAGGSSGDAGGSSGGAENDASFTDAPSVASLSETFSDPSMETTDRYAALRYLAMQAHFDSSTMLLGLDGADAETSAAQRRALLASDRRLTFWGHGSFTAVDNDYNSGSEDNRYDGDVWGYNIGADYRIADGVIAGLSLGYNRSDLDTAFNQGSYEENAWVVSPYAILRPLPDLTIVAEAGYALGDIDVTRSNGSITGETDSAMWYAAVKSSYAIHPIEGLPLELDASVALVAASKTIDAYQETGGGQAVATSRSHTRQAKTALKAAYDLSFDRLTVTPFVEVGFVYDFVDELNHDKSAIDLGGGLQLADAESGFAASLEGGYLAGRKDYSEYSLAGAVSYSFDVEDSDGAALGVATPYFGSNVDVDGGRGVEGGMRFNAGGLTSGLSLGHRIDAEDSPESHARLTLRIAL